MGQGSTVESDKFTSLCSRTRTDMHQTHCYTDHETDDATGGRSKVNEIHGSQDY